jgi:hypothetical protein
MTSRIRRSIAIGAMLAGFVVCGAPLAAPDAKAQVEIDHLLAFVASSPCRFVRGGSEYDGKAAREHLARKFDAAKSMVGSADQFVEHVASSSSITGEGYRVRCGSRELTSKAWLGEELARYRRPAKAQ